jgi:hypothetical protein
MTPVPGNDHDPEDSMPGMADHAKPAASHRDHLLWILYLIGGCCLLEVSPAWARIAAACAFLPAGPVPTEWTLPVVIEAYWGAALYGWLQDPAGRRSRRFAASTAVIVFLLSLSGQVAVHLFLAAHAVTPPPALTGFAAALPVLVLGCGAILVHLRHADRERAAAEAEAHARALADAGAEAQAADERTALRAELAAEREAHAAHLAAARAARAAELQAAQQAHAAEADARIAAEQRAGNAEAEAERLGRKLAAQKPKTTRTAKPNAGRAKEANAAPGQPPLPPFDAHARAREIWTANPEISGRELGAAVGLGERWGQIRKTEFARAAAPARSDTSEP